MKFFQPQWHPRPVVSSTLLKCSKSATTCRPYPASRALQTKPTHKHSLYLFLSLALPSLNLTPPAQQTHSKLRCTKRHTMPPKVRMGKSTSYYNYTQFAVSNKCHIQWTNELHALFAHLSNCAGRCGYSVETLHIASYTTFTKFNYETQFSLRFCTRLSITVHLKDAGFIVIFSTMNS